MCGLSTKAMVPEQMQDSTTTADIHGAISDELLICKICYTRFSKSHLPKLLGCSHTFCAPCLQKHFKLNRNKNSWKRIRDKADLFLCPLCRKGTSLPEGRVENLSNNFTILSLLEIIGPGSCSEQVRSAARMPDVTCRAKLLGQGNCVLCNKHYPESLFPCGHCICSSCQSGQALGACSKEGVNCPLCKERNSSDRKMENIVRPAQKPESTQSQHEQNEEENNSPGVSTPAETISNSETSQVTPHCSTFEPSDTAINSKAVSDSSYTVCESDKSTSTGDVNQSDQKPLHSNDTSRPPPYNPVYVEKPMHGKVNAVKHLPAVTGSDCKLQVFQPESPVCQLSYHRHISHPLSETHLHGRLQSHLYDRHDPAGTHSSCYELPGQRNESPYTLRRSQSLRRPPLPPRRHSSSLAMLNQSRVRRQSISYPHDKGNDMYQSPTELYGVAPPVPPRRRIYDSPQSSPMRCIKKFGRYSEVRMQTSTFRQPTKVDLSDQGDIVVVDIQQMTVQVFTMAGDYLAMFKVIGVQGASFFRPDHLAIATHRGVDIYTMAGEKLQEINIGLTVNTCLYKFGFLAATPRSVLIYRQSLVLAKKIEKRRIARSFFFKKSSHFENIKDVAMTMDKHIAVLDGTKAVIHIIDEDGLAYQTIDPSLESCGQLCQPESITVDRSNNLYVADTGNQRVLKFSPSGSYSKCLLNCKTSSVDHHLAPYGINTTKQGHLVVVISGDKIAEVRIYQMS